MAFFCLLHGAWHEPSCWDRVREGLTALGHGSAAPDLPLHDPSSGYDDRIRPALEACRGLAEPIVVVGHSQSASLGPLVAAARPIALVIHLCPRRLAGLEPPSGAPAPFREGLPMPQQGGDGTSSWDLETAVATMYARLPAETGRALAQRLRPMAMPPDEYPLPAYPDVPSALIYCAEDEFFTPEWERFMAHELLDVEPIELPGGHFPMVAEPDRLVEVLHRLAPA